ncbi:MAG TPA: hypothetical protein D7H76_01105, partial [Candidatus Poseidoniales archaeon]
MFYPYPDEWNAINEGDEVSDILVHQDTRIPDARKYLQGAESLQPTISASMISDSSKFLLDKTLRATTAT